MSTRPLIGAHVSVAGGAYRAFERGEELGCEAIQIFVKNANQWRAAALEGDAVERFRRQRQESSIGPVAAHASYLINLAATAPKTLARSRDALADELARCAALGVDALVLHPGAHLGDGVETGIERVVDSLLAVLPKAAGAGDDGATVRLLLENTAGQGTVLGSRLAELAAMIDGVAASDGAAAARIGVCIDTCHAFAAGYPIHQAEGLDAFLDEFEALLGLPRLGLIHVNDSKKPFDSRRDRHANLGEGEIGADAFAAWVKAPRLAEVPFVIETPHGDDEAGYRADLALLRAAR